MHFEVLQVIVFLRVFDNVHGYLNLILHPKKIVHIRCVTVKQCIFYKLGINSHLLVPA